MDGRIYADNVARTNRRYQKFVQQAVQEGCKMETITITFNDGTQITALRNATTYVVDAKPEFPEDLSDVVITDESGEETVFESAEIVECAGAEGKYLFTILAKTRDLGSEVDSNRCDIEYIAAVSGIDIGIEA